MPASRRHRPGLIAAAGTGAPAWSRTSADAPALILPRGRGGREMAPPATPVLESLARLTELRDRGLLTDAEFAAATASLLR